MASVTEIINQTRQPRGGYIPTRLFTKHVFDDGCRLNEKENIKPMYIGLAVDYLTRYMLSENLFDAFEISILGAHFKEIFASEELVKIDKEKGFDIETLLGCVNGLDDTSIVAACKIVTYDSWYRNGFGYLRPDQMWPNKATCENIRIMVQRSISFLENYKDHLITGFTFEERDRYGRTIHNGYTDKIHAADGDFLTRDCIWDFKVSKNDLTTKNTMQLAIYYLMGRHSGMEIFQDVEKIGVYNPRLNCAYALSVSVIDKSVLKELELNIIGYDETL